MPKIDWITFDIWCDPICNFLQEHHRYIHSSDQPNGMTVWPNNPNTVPFTTSCLYTNMQLSTILNKEKIFQGRLNCSQDHHNCIAWHCSLEASLNVEHLPDNVSLWFHENKFCCPHLLAIFIQPNLLCHSTDHIAWIPHQIPSKLASRTGPAHMTEINGIFLKDNTNGWSLEVVKKQHLT